MKRVAITQRVDAIAGRDETRDGVDIRFARMLWDMGFLPMPVSSAVPDKAAYVAGLAPDAIVLTGGNDIGTAPDRDAMERALLGYAAMARLPVFGVCRGMQMMNVYQGGSLVVIDGHVATRHRVSGVLWPEAREVNSYHSIAVLPEFLGRDLEILATASDGSVEAMRHVVLPWLAVMWHPERETPFEKDDLGMMRRHLGQT